MKAIKLTNKKGVLLLRPFKKLVAKKNFICSLLLDGKKKTLLMHLTEEVTCFTTVFTRSELMPYLNEKYKISFVYQNFK